MLLITPSRADFNRAHDQLAAQPIPDSELLAQLMPEHNILVSLSTDQEYNEIVVQTSHLHRQPEDFEATSFLSSTSYMHISDPNLPGPEYDIPRDMFLREAPSESQTRRLWESMYEQFRDLRITICGLDLEPMPTEDKKEPIVPDTKEVELG